MPVEVGAIFGFGVDPNADYMSRVQALLDAYPRKAAIRSNTLYLEPEKSLVLGSSDDQPLPFETLAAVLDWVSTGKGTMPDISSLPDVSPAQLQ